MHLILNNNASSMLSDDGRKHAYIEFIEDIAIETIPKAEGPKDILVLGAGAFTLGHKDTTNTYDYVDIDESLLELSEEYILRNTLSENKIFHAVPARAFLASTDKHYDLIVLDAYLGDLTLPEHLVTVEFFQQVKSKLKPNGSVVGNFISSSNFANIFAQNLDNTLRSVFPHISRHAIDKKYNVWNTNSDLMNNIVYIYSHHDGAPSGGFYTDNKNRVFYDKPHRRDTLEE